MQTYTGLIISKGFIPTDNGKEKVKYYNQILKKTHS